MLLRSPCKKLKPYDNPFWGFEQRYQEQEINKKRINYLKFPLAPMGVLAPGSAHVRPSARPPNRAYLCALDIRDGSKMVNKL